MSQDCADTICDNTPGIKCQEQQSSAKRKRETTDNHLSKTGIRTKKNNVVMKIVKRQHHSTCQKKPKAFIAASTKNQGWLMCATENAFIWVV